MFAAKIDRFFKSPHRSNTTTVLHTGGWMTLNDLWAMHSEYRMSELIFINQILNLQTSFNIPNFLFHNNLPTYLLNLHTVHSNTDDFTITSAWLATLTCRICDNFIQQITNMYLLSSPWRCFLCQSLPLLEQALSAQTGTQSVVTVTHIYLVALPWWSDKWSQRKVLFDKEAYVIYTLLQLSVAHQWQIQDLPKWGTMASAPPKLGSGGGAPSRVQGLCPGRAPGAGSRGFLKLNAFCQLS